MVKRDREVGDEFIEREIVTGLITSTEYVQHIARVYKPDCLASDMAKTLAGWCFEYFKKYNRAPGKDIQGIYIEKLKAGLQKEKAVDIEMVLQGLSEDYEQGVDFNSDFLFDRTIKHFQNTQANVLHDRQQLALDSDDFDEFYTLLTDFKPVQLSDLYEGESINAGELYDMDIKGPKWLLNDLIPVGLTILGGRSKVGKSYFMLNLAMALAQGKYVFGDEENGFRGRKGQILYLSLEDGKQRFQSRMRGIDPEPNRELLGRNLRPRFQWDKLNRGGIQAITDWVEKMDHPKLVVIDTLAKVWSKKSSTGGGGLYAEEYAIYSPLADLAHKHQISVVLVTHTTKGRATDVFDDILGGMGTQGPADNLIVLANDDNGRKRLSIRGKDIEERHLAFETPGGPARWVCLGDVGDMQMTAERQEILDLLKEYERPLTLREIKAGLKLRQSGIATAHIIVRKMLSDGVLEQPTSYGPYQVAGHSQKMANELISDKLSRRTR